MYMVVFYYFKISIGLFCGIICINYFFLFVFWCLFNVFNVFFFMIWNWFILMLLLILIGMVFLGIWVMFVRLG